MVTQRQLRCLPKDSVDLIYWLFRVCFSRPGRVRKYFCSFPAGPSLKALLQLPGRANRKGAQRNVGAETRCAFECYVRASPSAKWAESSRVRMNSRSYGLRSRPAPVLKGTPPLDDIKAQCRVMSAIIVNTVFSPQKGPPFVLTAFNVRLFLFGFNCCQTRACHVRHSFGLCAILETSQSM